jgi:hypothetical protein
MPLHVIMHLIIHVVASVRVNRMIIVTIEIRTRAVAARDLWILTQDCHQLKYAFRVQTVPSPTALYVGPTLWCALYHRMTRGVVTLQVHV